MPVLLQGAVVRRVDNSLGAVLDLPPIPDPHEPPGEPTEHPAAPRSPTVAFAHISNIADRRIEHLDKALRLNSQVTARVVGTRPFEGVSVVSLKGSVVDRGIEGIRDLKPGGMVSGSVASVEESGLLVSLTSNLRSGSLLRCPTALMAGTESCMRCVCFALRDVDCAGKCSMRCP